MDPDGSTADVQVDTQSGWARGSFNQSQADIRIFTSVSAVRGVPRSSLAVERITPIGQWSSTRTAASRALVQIAAQQQWNNGHPRGSLGSIFIQAQTRAVTGRKSASSLAQVLLSANTKASKQDMLGSLAVVRIKPQGAWYVYHPKEATRASQVSVQVGVQTAPAVHPKSVYAHTAEQAVVSQAETTWRANRGAAGQVLVRVAPQSLATQFYDRTGWRDVDIVATLLESSWSASVYESRWQAELEQPMRISALTTDYVVVRLESDVPLDMAPPFMGLAKQGLPTEWFQAGWRGNSAPVIGKRDRFYRKVEWLVGPESDGQRTAAGIWQVYYDLRDLPTRSVEPAGVLLVGKV